MYKLFKDSIHGNPLLPGAVSTYTASLEVTQNGLNFSAGSTTFDSNGDASDTTWRNQQDFLTWTKSESFRRAHKNAGDYSKLYLGHPEFEGFEVAL